MYIQEGHNKETKWINGRINEAKAKNDFPTTRDQDSTKQQHVKNVSDSLPWNKGNQKKREKRNIHSKVFVKIRLPYSGRPLKSSYRSHSHPAVYQTPIATSVQGRQTSQKKQTSPPRPTLWNLTTYIILKRRYEQKPTGYSKGEQLELEPCKHQPFVIS